MINEHISKQLALLSLNKFYELAEYAKLFLDNNMTKLSPVLFIPHGGGPLPILGDIGHTNLIHFLKNLSSQMNKPSAIVIISAHWEENMVTITSHEEPPLIYDYYGFSSKAYEIDYPIKA